MVDQASEDPRIGTVLGERYLVCDRIGEGAMGIVYRAERVGLGRAVAIKFLHEMYSMDRKFYGRFEREARAMSSLTHPNCVSVIDYGFDQSPYIVMDFAEGKTLRDVLDEGPLPPSRAMGLQRQLLAALAHAHGLGIIHRDVKPSNIMISQATGMGDHLLILDFGLAKLVYKTHVGGPSTAAQILGTPSYMSPEQTKGTNVDFRSDLYSAGVVLFEMLTGIKPFRHTNPMEVVRMQRLTPAPHLRDLAPHLPFSEELEALVAHALQKIPDDRVQSAGEFLSALADLPETTSTTIARLSNDAAPSSPRAHDAVDQNATTEAIKADHVVAHVMPHTQNKTSDEALPGTTVRGKRPPEKKASPQQFMPTDEGFHLPGWAYVVMGIAVLSVGVIIAASFLYKNGEPQPAPVNPSVPMPSTADDPPAVETPTKVYDLADVQVLMKNQKYKDAAEGLNQLRKIDPRNAYYPFLQGSLYFKLNDFTQGIDHYKQTLELDADYAKRKALNVDLIRALGDEKAFAPARKLLVSSVGKEAVMYLNRAANADPNPIIRKRALALAKRLDK